MTQPYILVAPNGARRGHDDHIALPVTTQEIVETATACQLAGANGLHLHVRDADGQHSLDGGRYLETLAALEDAVSELDLQITTEAAGVFDVASQLDCLKHVKPAWASISVREIDRSPELADHVYGLCAEQGTRVQHILYDAKDAALLDHWRANGTVRQAQSDRLFVLGRYATGQRSTPADLDPFLTGGLPTSPWMICAFGPDEHACLTRAATLGGDIRVGFENSLTNASGTPWKDNAASVSALVQQLQRGTS
ncbi:3-keto-5-aminohexanoate cleavage protein [Shimia thalassica]|uniref:3-keto-5-aminohexanoate cleavage protein n=1 Tax=Shimia thalassica TaxID=1715693 RepID=UPI001C0950EE|nr:3-keto-5-aminohexanoate cleavage protein [Shimia thalassica]MBU2944914.1 3-keto-5-aminohexanoate cleavage protein [Shimia thalassica]MDO6504780.1 3-keto-5-aminohexanoate cleavage protein [Shimia thalassica]